MVAIIITVIICATVIVTVRQDITFTVKHVTTTEISESMIEYQKMLNENAASVEPEDDDIQESLDSVVSAISNIFESDGD